MSLLNASLPTLADLARLKDPNGAIAAVAEVLTQKNPIIEDAVAKEGNLETGEVFTSRTALPSVYFRRFNQGIAPSKSRTDQVTETCAIMNGRSKVDRSLARLGGNERAFRASEDRAFLQSLNNEAESSIIYASSATAPEEFMGLAPRLNATSGTGGSQIIKADAAAAGSDQTSIWGIVWGLESAYLFFPKGSKAGITHTDLGLQLTEDSDGLEFLALVTDWEWQLGLAVKDFRQVTRICNIDTSAISATGDNIIPAMVRGYHQLWKPNDGRLVWYCNRTIATYLHLQAREKVSGGHGLTFETLGGKPVLHFMGAPIRVTDGITNTEAVIS